MVAPVSVVVISGTLHRPSKTDDVLDAVLAALTARVPTEVLSIHALDLGSELVAALAGGPGETLRDQFAVIAVADLVVIGTPVYKGSYTGLLKLYIDLLDVAHLEGKPVVLVATGGSDQHSLVIEHELRPLVGFFRAHSIPVGVYAARSDFLPEGGFSERLAATIAATADSAVSVVSAAR